MKKITFILSLLFAFVCGNGLLQAAPLIEAADTLDFYTINGQPVDNFDGSQLVGKMVTSYDITLINHPVKGPVRIHEIHLNGRGGEAGKAYCVNSFKGHTKKFGFSSMYVESHQNVLIFFWIDQTILTVL